VEEEPDGIMLEDEDIMLDEEPEDIMLAEAPVGFAPGTVRVIVVVESPAGIVSVSVDGD
jgi:hypothetical protein